MNKVIQAIRAVDAAEELEIELDPAELSKEAEVKTKVARSMETTSTLIDQAVQALEEMRAAHQSALGAMHDKNWNDTQKADEDILAIEEEIKLLNQTLLERKINRTTMLHNMSNSVQQLVTEQTRAEADQIHVINSFRAMEQALKMPVDIRVETPIPAYKEELVLDATAFLGKHKPHQKERVTKPDPAPERLTEKSLDSPVLAGTYATELTSNYVDQDADQTSVQTETSSSSGDSGSSGD